MKTISRFAIIAALFSTISVTGCMGGGTIGTGVTSLGGGLPRHVNLTFKVTGLLIDSAQKPLPRTKIEITSLSRTVSAVSNDKGQFAISLTPTSGEELTIRVTTKGKVYTTSTYISPAGKEIVSATISLVQGGGIVFETLD